MTPQQLKAIRARLGLTQGELARRLHVTALTVLRWENAQVNVPYSVELAIKQIESEEE